MPIVKYSSDDFIFDVKNDVQLQNLSKHSASDSEKLNGNGVINPQKLRSEFQDMLRTRWDEAMTKGMFKYELSESSVYTRIIPGRQNYVAQFNAKRFGERRQPQQIEHVNLPFDEKKFNFNKIHNDEILFKFQSENAPEETDNVVIINVSPLEYGHVLMVPSVKACLNQVLTEKCIQRAIELILLVPDPAFKIGYNSLMALASVNHLHVHGWFLKEKMPCDKWDASELFEDIFVLNDGVVPGFGFQVLDESDISLVANKIFKISQYFTENEIPHNTFMCRGESFEKTNRKCVRVFLWPRKPVVVHSKALSLFNCAVAELAGHLPCSDLEGVNELTEERIEATLKEVAFCDEEFKQIIKELTTMFKKD